MDLPEPVAVTELDGRIYPSRAKLVIFSSWVYGAPRKLMPIAFRQNSESDTSQLSQQ
jgi:hypothetical protein